MASVAATMPAAMDTEKQPAETTNVLLTSFPGLAVPRTLCIPVPTNSTVADVYEAVSSKLPISIAASRLYLTTHGNKQLTPHSTAPLTSLTSTDASILSLRLSAALCGGKGGFGSQLRAAGGKMSSRNKNRGDNHASSRNLDGRRLRTVTEAKALAEYLALKPEFDKKAKEERVKRWEAVVEASDRREDEIRSGKGQRANVDAAWMEDKEEIEDKMRAAVLAAMERGMVRGESDESAAGSEGSGSEGVEVEAQAPKGKGKGKERVADSAAPQRKVWGWDEDEDMDSSDEE